MVRYCQNIIGVIYSCFMEARDKLYKVFYDEKNRWLYFSKLKLKTGLSNSSLQNILGKLKDEGEIEVRKETSNIFFRIVHNKKVLIFSRIDYDRLDELNLGVKIPLKNWLKLLPSELEFVILFGSSSRKKEGEGSDIDLLIILHHFLDESLQALYEKEAKQKVNKIVKETNSESNYPLKVLFIDRDSFKTSKDYLILQAKETGFPIFGIDRYYKKDEED